MMKVFETMFVIRKEASKSQFPLAYMTHFETNSAFQSRKSTGLTWARGYSKNTDIDEMTIPNEPIAGFKFNGSDVRYSTSNKWFNIQDPRGFTLQISTENVAELLNYTVIAKGTITDKLVWTRVGSLNYLTYLDHPDYLKSIAPVISRHPIEGDFLKFGNGDSGFLMGRFFVVKLHQGEDWSKFHYSTWTTGRGSPTITYTVSREPKPKFVYAHTNYNGLQYDYRASLGKYTIEPQDCPFRMVPFGTPHFNSEYELTAYVFFATEAEASAYNPTTDEIKTIFHTRPKKP
jgi:hypothetical protein